MSKLHELIDTSSKLDVTMVNNWNTVIPILKTKYLSTVHEITPVQAEMYRNDLYGLFKHVIGVQDKFIYPHIRVNGYDTSWNYDSKKLNFALISGEALDKYYTRFKKESSSRT